MNRYLLAGCAAVALVLGSGAANAQTKFEVKVGGDVFAEWGYVDQDKDSGLRSTEMRNRFRFNLIPTAKADNGLEYGARIRVRADTGTPNSTGGRTLAQDNAYIFVQGGFGQVRAGTAHTYNDETGIVSRPIDYLPFGLYDQAASWINGAGNNGLIGGGNGSTLANGSMLWPTFGDVATRIMYISPRFAGLQIGGTYTPRNDDSQNSINRQSNVAGTGFLGGVSTTTGGVTSNVGGVASFQGSMQDMYEIGLNYDQKFDAFGVKLGGGYYGGRASDNTNGASFKNLNAWQVGGQFSFAGFAIGASYTDWGKSGLTKLSSYQLDSRVVTSPRASIYKSDATTLNVGAQYTTGPIVIGAGWMRGEDSGDLRVSGKRRVDMYELGASYTVAPGLAVQAQYDYFDIKNDQSTAAVDRDDKGSIVILRTTLAF